MQENLEKVISGQSNIEELDVEAEIMEFKAQRYHKQAKDLKSIMFWKRFRIIMLGLFVLGLIVFLFLLFR